MYIGTLSLEVDQYDHEAKRFKVRLTGGHYTDKLNKSNG